MKKKATINTIEEIYKEILEEKRKFFEYHKELHKKDYSNETFEEYFERELDCGVYLQLIKKKSFVEGEIYIGSFKKGLPDLKKLKKIASELTRHVGYNPKYYLDISLC